MSDSSPYFSIEFDGETFTAENLPQAAKRHQDNPYAAKTISFCRQWRSGKERFTLHTSGSTGKPKPIAVTRAQMRASAQATLQALRLQAGDRALLSLNADFVAGRMMLVRSLVGGLRLTVREPSANPLADFPDSARFDFAAFVPLQLDRILRQTPQKLPLLNAMKALIVGGAPVGSALQKKIRQHVTAPVFATYGMTETLTHIALRDLRSTDDRYRALSPDIRIGQDERGCLTVAAPVTLGQTVVTNDRIELIDPQTFRWLGRADHVINSGGYKVQAEAVERAAETAFDQIPLHRRFFAFGQPDDHLGQRVTLAIEGEKLNSEIEKTLLSKLREALHPYQTPKALAYFPRFAETPTGKVNRLATIGATA